MTKTLPNSQVCVLEDYGELCQEVVRQIWILSEQVISTKGCFTLVLSGGSTPQGIYALMADSPYRDRFQWKNIHFFWGDERWVPPESAKSNYGEVFKSLLKRVNIPSENIFSIPTKTGDVQTSARLYEETIGSFFKLRIGEWPCFDLVLLGMGRDGHVASLFPEHPALWVNDRLAVAVSQKGLKEERITLTFPVINHADMIFLVISGEEKADIVQQVLDSENKDLFPAQKIQPDRGRLCWFLDRESAAKSGHIPDPSKRSKKS
jgi:6-phosphogluconolactonase